MKPVLGNTNLVNLMVASCSNPRVLLTVNLSCPLCPLETKCHMESITKQNRQLLCIAPEKCMVIIKYIILHFTFGLCV